MLQLWCSFGRLPKCGPTGLNLAKQVFTCLLHLHDLRCLIVMNMSSLSGNNKIFTMCTKCTMLLFLSLQNRYNMEIIINSQNGSCRARYATVRITQSRKLPFVVIYSYNVTPSPCPRSIYLPPLTPPLAVDLSSKLSVNSGLSNQNSYHHMFSG